MKNLKVVFLGTPDFAVGIMKAILNEGGNLVACVTVADKPAGRGQRVNESAVKRFAVEHGIPVLQPVRLKEQEFLDELASYNADVFVVVAFRMLPAEVWKMPRRGTFNLHASLLPDYRGAAPINWAIMNGDTQTGVSTFFIDEKIDTGNVIGQIKMDIGKNETAGELHDRMIVTGGKLVVETLSKIANDSIVAVPQSAFENAQQRPAPKLFRENTQINWTADVHEVHNHIRGLSPYPAAWTVLTDTSGNNRQVKILRTEILEENTLPFSPGIREEGQNIVIQGKGGKLNILEWQFEGKRKMRADEWLAGNNPGEWKICAKPQ